MELDLVFTPVRPERVCRLHITASFVAAISVIMLNTKLLASALDSGIQMCLMWPTGGGIR